MIGDNTMRASQVDPLQLRAAVTDAVAGGAWSANAVIASVASDSVLDRAEIMATLWDLEGDGVVAYSPGQFPGFRLC